jgi:hypothetical protein
VIEVPTFALEDGEHSAVAQGASGVVLSKHRIGDVSEFEFCKQATLRGWRVRHMGGSEQGYDAIISRSGVRPLFVQVKLARWKQKNAESGCYDIKNHAAGKTYSLVAYDILACHLEDIGKWVFYARQEFGSRSGTAFIPPDLRQRISRSLIDARDPDNWELLDQVAATHSQESGGIGLRMSYPTP